MARQDVPKRPNSRTRPHARPRRAARAAAVGNDAAPLTALSHDLLLEAVQRQAFRFFWEGAHPASGLAPDRRSVTGPSPDDPVAVGGSGFGVMALLVAIERGWVTRAAALERLLRMCAVLSHARCYHGALPHFIDGRTGATIPFTRKDDAGDLVETSFLCMGLICARQYFAGATPEEKRLRKLIAMICDSVEWTWYTQGGRTHLYWHWSPFNGWVMDHAIRGWNECLITYVLAAGANVHAIDPAIYHQGFASGPAFRNGNSYYGIELPLGPPYGGPLFFAHYSFLGLDPRGLKDRYADYWRQNVAHVRIHHAHAIANPNGHSGYGADCWGLTASDDPDGYEAHAPDCDNGTVAPTAALASLPYAPREALRAARHFLTHRDGRLWGRYGFIDAYCERLGWYADTFLAIDQGPIVVMIENHRSGLPWQLFMAAPEVQRGLRALGFTSPWLDGTRGA